MKTLYTWSTPLGPVQIVQTESGAYEVRFEGRPFGTYSAAEQAALALAHGRTIILKGGLTAASLGIPKNLDAWSKSQAVAASPPASA